MYIPRRYEEKDQEKIFSFIRSNSFAVMVSVSDGLPVASHIPLVLEKNGRLQDVLSGHISKGNQQKYTLQNGTKVLCIFAGPHAYISPGWYTEYNVPTWNYLSVHVYGTIQLIEGIELKAALGRMVDAYEQSQPQPMRLQDIPEKTFQDDFRGIIGFEILIDDIQAVAKLSQNRDKESYHSVIHHLQEGDSEAQQVAAAMQDNSNRLFPET